MSERIMNYHYAQIDDDNIVIAVSLLWSVITETHPFYNYMIPIIEANESLLGQRYIGRDADGYGLFEVVEEPTETETPEEPKQSETVTE